MHRFYDDQTDLATGVESALDKRESHHAIHVLRLKPGDPLSVFDRSGREFISQTIEMKGGRLGYRAIEERPPLPPRSIQPTLCFALAKSDKTDWIFQKATELGAARFIPFHCERSVARIRDSKKAEKKRQRWRAIALDAVKQCGRRDVPVIESVTSFRELLIKSLDYHPRFACFENKAAQRLSQAAVFEKEPERRDVAVLIGPEGGFTDDEMQACEEAGWTPVTLGTHILRCETAAVAALTLLNAAAGEM